MIKQLEFDSNGFMGITRDAAEKKDTLMDIYARRLKAGEKFGISMPDMETAVLLLDGKIELEWNGNKYIAERHDLFKKNGVCLHAGCSTEIIITAIEESEILIQQTENKKDFPAVLYKPPDIKTEIFGDGMWNNTAKRRVVTYFDYDNAPYSNMVMGEVFANHGSWAGYIPHNHNQPEVYYFRFSKPQGFGASFIGDEVFKTTDRSAAFIEGGKMHTQVTAPGYYLYFCWMIRHLENDPWVSRVMDPAHAWLLENLEV